LKPLGGKALGVKVGRSDRFMLSAPGWEDDWWGAEEITWIQTKSKIYENKEIHKQYYILDQLLLLAYQ